MKPQQSVLLSQIETYVSTKLDAVDAGHDMSHIRRVLQNARQINQVEKGNEFLIEAGVLLHDVTDEKLFNKEVAEQELFVFLRRIGLGDDVVDTLCDIITCVSFGGQINGGVALNKEQKIVRDADRLDAIGAIGIARAFHYGGSKNREIFNPDIPPQIYQSTQDYRKNMNPTINHFYEKLLLLKDKMETKTGLLLAQSRHDYMMGFLKQFYSETGETGFSI